MAELKDYNENELIKAIKEYVHDHDYLVDSPEDLILHFILDIMNNNYLNIT